MKKLSILIAACAAISSPAMAGNGVATASNLAYYMRTKLAPGNVVAATGPLNGKNYTCLMPAAAGTPYRYPTDANAVGRASSESQAQASCNARVVGQAICFWNPVNQVVYYSPGGMSSDPTKPDPQGYEFANCG